MITKDNKIKFKFNLKNTIYVLIVLFFLIFSFIFCKLYFPTNKSYAKEVDNGYLSDFKVSQAEKIDIDKILDENINNKKVEKITTKEEILEYITTYKTNKEIPKGISYVVQEGREGKQEIKIKSIYDKDGNLISEEQIGATITKASSNKIVEIGGASYSSNYKVKKGDNVYITADIVGLMEKDDKDSRKITTLKKDDELKVLEIKQNWYNVKINNMSGWVEAECTTFINPNANAEEKMRIGMQKSKEQLLSELNFNMKLNKPSGMTLEQFKKVLSDNKDVNKIFSNNADLFYYIERQYNINGIFVASIGIHESAWGTSNIAIKKNNLFGYGAYDSNPFYGAYEFSNYSESIDLVSRVLVKYYLNKSGTAIYGGEKAVGTCYNGETISAVNVKYATDKNWANSVFSYMKYLYNKL